MSNTKVIVGLGNPGHEFEDTPHNAGFRAIDALALKLEPFFLFSSEDNRFEYSVYNYEGIKIYLVKTLSYMNLSGVALNTFFEDTKLSINRASDLLVLHDELDIPLANIKVVQAGSPGNNNGCKNINEALGLNNNWNRVKIGIAPDNKVTNKIGYVIGKMHSAMLEEAAKGEDKAATAALDWAKDGIVKAMNIHNTKVKDETTE